MAKKFFSTYTKSDANRLKALVRDFNRKRNDAEKTIGYQPPKIKYSEITQTIRSRQEYNRVYNTYARYLKRGAEKKYTNSSGITTTRWMRNEINYAIQRINNARAKKRAEYENLPGGIRRRAYDDLNLEQRKNHADTITSRSYLNKYFQSVQNEAGFNYYSIGDENYKKNYLKSLRTQYGGVPGYNELRKLVSSIPPSKLLQASAQNPTFTIDFNYGQEEAQLRVEYLTEKFNEYLGLD